MNVDEIFRAEVKELASDELLILSYDVSKNIDPILWSYITKVSIVKNNSAFRERLKCAISYKSKIRKWFTMIHITRDLNRNPITPGMYFITDGLITS